MLFMVLKGRRGRRGRNGWRGRSGNPALPAHPAVPAFLMTHRLAIAAMIASDGRFDQTPTLGVSARHECQEAVARVGATSVHRRRFGDALMAMTRDRVA